MNIIFVGGFFPEQFTGLILKKSKHQIQNAANIFQWAFIKGLECNLGRALPLITAPYLGWWPKYYYDLFVKTCSFANGDDRSAGTMVGFLNLPLIKNVFKYLGLVQAVQSKLSRNDQNIIIVYSLDAAYLKAALKAKSAEPSIKVCVIIPDLHEFPGEANVLYRWYIKYIEKPIFYHHLHQIDFFVVLTDKMIDYLEISHKPWVTIEGLYDLPQSTEPDPSFRTHSKEKIILYTGALEYMYGIRNMLDAFRAIPSADYRLWICGGGVAASFVEERAASDSRINYFGLVSRQEVARLQREATLLINPRSPEGEYNKYSFPSKTMEYFASGTPTLMYRIDGVPEEYFKHCYTVEVLGAEGLSEAMHATCQLHPEVLKLKGSQARDFILKKKNSAAQCRKVLDMFKKLGKSE